MFTGIYTNTLLLINQFSENSPHQPIRALPKLCSHLSEPLYYPNSLSNTPNLPNTNLSSEYFSKPESYHLKRSWDSFWKNGAPSAKGSHVKRHIVMIAIMKSAMYAIRDFSYQNDCVEELTVTYRQFLAQYNTQSPYHVSLEDLGSVDIHSPIEGNSSIAVHNNQILDQYLMQLEKRVFSLLINMKFNIFIGNHAENKAASDTALILQYSETNILEKIATADTALDLYQSLSHWYLNTLCSNRTFRDKTYRKIRKEIESNIGSILKLDEANIDNQNLDDLKKDVTSRITSLYDSLTVDTSNASHVELKKWQNQALLPLQADFMHICEEPNIPKFKGIISRFMACEQIGASIIGIDLKHLNDYEQYPHVLNHFIACISER